MNITIEFTIFNLVSVPQSTLKKQFGVFRQKVAQNRFLWSKTEKVNIIIESANSN